VSPPSIGVIGLGHMAQALIEPLITSGSVDPDQVTAVVGRPESVAALKQGVFGRCVIHSAESAEAAEVLTAPLQLLAIKPQQVEHAAASLPAVGGSPLLVSVLAGVNLSRLERLFPSHRVVRAVPNTPALVGQGLTALAWGDNISSSQRQEVQALFAGVGEVLELAEEKLDAFLALTSSGPAFVALVAEAMADGAVAAGLPRDLAQRLAHRTLAGSAALLDQRHLHPASLKDMVASPGGTTIAGVRALERGGLRSALMEAVIAAAERSRELA
jgi:pyrroline-5-carboxylate reductase